MSIENDPVETFGQQGNDHSTGRTRVALLVLGMHRSGTSALARVLSLLGCSLPKTLLGSNPTNPTGHWESDAIREFNDELLEAAGSSWNDWQILNPSWVQSPVRNDFMQRAARVLNSEFGEAPFFVLKDPRICRFAPFWIEVLRKEGVEPRIIIPVRNPIDVASSLERRDGIDLSVGYLIWLRHILDAERGTRGFRRVFTTYNGLVENWSSVMDRVADRLDLRWPRSSPRVASEIEAFLGRELQHYKHVDLDVLAGSLIPIWVRQAYDIFLRWAQTSESPEEYEILEDIRQRLNEAGTAFGKPMVLLQAAETRLQEAQSQLDELRDAETRFHEMQGREDALKMELRAALDRAASAEHLSQERDAAISRAAEIESALLQRREELRQVWADLEAERSRAAALDEMVSGQTLALEKVNRKLGEADAWVLDLTAERRLNERELARRQRELETERARSNRLIVVESELENARIHLSTKSRSLEILQREHSESRNKLEEMTAALEETRKRANAAASALEREQERSRQLVAVEGELEKTRLHLSTANDSLETLQRKQSESETKLDEMTAILEKTEKLAKAVVSQRSQTSNEIAIVSQLLRDSEQATLRNSDDLQWSRKMHAILLNRPWWWGFLPRNLQLRKIRAAAERKGLFDADAYLARNPDVAASRADPLRHYILHGMNESRAR